MEKVSLLDPFTAGDTPSPRTQMLLRRGAYASVATALVLITIKAVAWLMTGSVSVLTTLIESLMDAGASLVNLWAIRQALQPASTRYRFGYGKAEPLAGLGQAAFVAGSAIFLILEGVTRLVEPAPIGNETIGIVVMVASMAITFALVRFQTYVVKATKSLAINADSLHYKGDFLIHGSVIVSLLLHGIFGWTHIDPIFAIAIALYILFNAKNIAVAALRVLMDRELDEAERQRIQAIALAHPEVINIHDMRTRSSGARVFIQFHLELKRDISLIRAHEISDQVEAKVRAAFPGAGVIIHQDPEGVSEPHAVFAGEVADELSRR